MLKIDDGVVIPDAEIDISAVRAPGPGGQNVNKVSSAVHLRFDIGRSAALGDELKARLLAMRDRRITKAGVVVIKSSRFRNQDRNREDALERLSDLVRKALVVPKQRRKTKPGRVAQEKRLEQKAHRARIKKLRKGPDDGGL